MTSSRTRRLVAIVLAASALAALLPAGASAEMPVPEAEHAHGVIRQAGGPEGIVVLEERPTGLFVGIGMTGVDVRAVTLQGATAPCGTVGFSTVRLGTFHPVKGRFAAGYIAGNADAVDAIASVRLMAGNHLVACRTLVRGDRDGVSCDIDPGQVDCPRREYVAPEVADFTKLLRLGVIFVVSTLGGSGGNGGSAGWFGAQLLILGQPGYPVVLTDAHCADGRGQKLGTIRVGADATVGIHRLAIPVATLAPVASLRIRPADGPTTCVDTVVHQRVAG